MLKSRNTRRKPATRKVCTLWTRPNLELLEDRCLLTSPGTWTALAASGTGPIASTAVMMLSNGSVLVQGTTSTNGGAYANTPLKTFYELTPDSSGNYVTGSWSATGSMSEGRLFSSTTMMQNGNVLIVGGEYSTPDPFTNSAEVFNPTANGGVGSWSSAGGVPTPLTTIDGVPATSQFGDDPTESLSNGTVLAGYFNSGLTYIYTTSTNTWSDGPTKLRNEPSDEESWVKLGNGDILSYDIFSSISTNTFHAQLYNPTANTWSDASSVNAASPPGLLSSPNQGYELGPAFLLPNGNAFFFGTNGNTAVYNPTTNQWSAGPSEPQLNLTITNNSFGDGIVTDGGPLTYLAATDDPGAMLPNGHILISLSPEGTLNTSGGYDFPNRAYLYEFDPVAGTFTAVPTPGGPYIGEDANFLNMVELPTGQVLMNNEFGQTAASTLIYTPVGSAANSSLPVISSVVSNGGGVYTLTGTQLTGISEGAAFGDDLASASNYPIVQLKSSSGTVYYAMTSNWSSTAVATGATPETTQFTLPAGLPAGTYTLTVIANGISSASLSFTPTITSLSPTSAIEGASSFVLTVNGSNFIGGATVDWNGTPLTTTFVNSGQLTAVVPTADLLVAGLESVTVVNPAPGGSQTSNAVTFTVNNPAPTLTSISPTSALVGSGNTTITLTGSNFVNGSTADFNGTAIVTTYVSGTTLTAVIPAADLTAAGTEPITVVTAGPGGGTSSPQTFTIVNPNNPAPTLTSISPTSAVVGSGNTTIILTGSGFIDGSTADFNGTPIPTLYVSATTLAAVIPAADLTTAGTEPITVVTAGPGGGTSAPQTFTIYNSDNPAPILTSISPTSALVGSGNTTITLTGGGFINGSSTADFNGAAIATTYVNATTLTAVIPAADLTAAGTEPITVVTAGPGGGTSSSQTFTIDNPAPTLTSISPTSAPVGSGNTTITLTGGSFISGSTADFNGTAIATSYVSGTTLTAVIPAADLTAVGTEPITVVTAGPGGGTSAPQTFTIGNPAPTLTSISPTSAVVGSGNTTITLTGSNFISGSTADFNGTAIATTYVSATSLTAVIPAADLTTAGTEPITVVTAGPGGGTSSSQTFTIDNPAPTLTSISPTSAVVGSGNTTITLTGGNFINGSTADFNGAAIATTYVSATSLTAVIPAADLTTAGTEPITVVTAGPGGGTSSSQTFTIDNPAPTLTSISPTSAPVGSGNTTITLTGGGFINGSSTADFNGVAIATTYVSATSLTAVIPAADLTTAGPEPITVVTAGPGGGTSAPQTFTIGNPAPTLTSISPTSALVGSGNTTITLTGSGFINGSTADFNGTAIATSYVSGTTLTAVIPAADLTTAGTEPITVVTAGPGGGTSASQTFTIGNPAPTLTSISPTSAPVGSGNTTITLTGGNFISGSSTADFNGTAIATTYVSATSLTAVIPAADLTAAGTEPITVVTAGPGGGTSSSQTFTIDNPAPTLTSISPTSAVVGSGNTTITLTGGNFINGSSTADFNGAAIATTYVNATTLTAVIPAADLTAAGTEPITVVTAGPGGGTSSSQTFTIDNPAPTLTSISPTSAVVGSGNTTITLTGGNFINGSTADFNGAAIATTYVSGTTLTAVIPAADLTAGGTEPITVVTAGPGGGTSSSQTFTIDNPAPTLTSISPTSAPVGSGNTTITLTGSGFINGSTADFNGVAIATSYVSGTTLTAVIPAADLTTAGTEPITVVTAGPGGGTSSSQTFTIDNPAPTLTSISPTSAPVGSGNTTITLTGGNFISGSSTADFNGAAIATTYVNATTLTAVIPAADLTTVGTEPITVVTAGPGGGTSAPQTFTVTVLANLSGSLPIQVDDNNANNNKTNGLGTFTLSGQVGPQLYGWTTVNAAAAFYGSEQVHAASATDTAEATWSYTLYTPSTAPYTLYASWAAAPGNATNATYKIYINSLKGPMTAVVVDQAVSPNTALFGATLIQKLATITVPAGSHTILVVLSDAANGTVVADGVFDPPDAAAGVASSLPTGEPGLAPSATAALASSPTSLSAPVDFSAASLAPVPAGAMTANALFLGASDPASDGRFDAPTNGSGSTGSASPSSSGPPSDVATLDQLFAAKSGGPTDVATLDQVFAGAADGESGWSNLRGPMDGPGSDGWVGDAF